MDLVTMARTAREGLARGLGALQTPGVPPQLAAAAEPIALAMSALHRIESSRGSAAAEAGPAALTSARQALAQLQTIPVTHPSVQQAVEAIASSLGMVHQITQQAGQGSVVPSPPTQPSGAFERAAEQPPQVAVVQSGWQPPAPASAQRANPIAQTQVAPAPVWQQPAAPTPAPAWQQPAPQQPAPQQPAPQQPAPQQPAQAAWQQPAPQAQAPAPQAAPAAAPGAASPGSFRVEAELGAHSATNFYKGLSGNDVVDSGGIFVATYSIPEIGTSLTIKVSMPGGYEFEALAVVRWTRDAPNSGADAPPGYGAQFTQIAPEARQLVYRYVRNREPLFHDDL